MTRVRSTITELTSIIVIRYAMKADHEAEMQAGMESARPCRDNTL